MIELKPCPFCKSEARMISAVRWLRLNGKRGRTRGLYWYVGCSDPECILYLDKELKNTRLIFLSRSRGLVVRRWNRRVE